MTASKQPKHTVLRAISLILKNYNLILQMTKRDVIGRYKGSVIGLAWSFFNPLIMLVVYTFMFSYVFKARWGNDIHSGSHVEFAVVLFAGLIVHSMFAEALAASTRLLTGNASYVKKVIFPLEILPVVTIFSALFHFCISLVALLLVQVVVYHTINVTVLFFPVVIFPYLFMMLGVVWFISAVSVYIKDIAQVVGVVTSILLFVSPIFYPVSMLPVKVRFLIELNPLTVIIEEMRQIIVYGQLPNMQQWLIYLLVSLCVASFGLWFFQKIRIGFADVL